MGLRAQVLTTTSQHRFREAIPPRNRHILGPIVWFSDLFPRRVYLGHIDISEWPWVDTQEHSRPFLSHLLFQHKIRHLGLATCNGPPPSGIYPPGRFCFPFSIHPSISPCTRRHGRANPNITPQLPAQFSSLLSFFDGRLFNHWRFIVKIIRCADSYTAS